MRFARGLLLLLLLGMSGARAASAADADSAATAAAASPAPGAPLPVLIDPSDLGMGVAVVFTHVPDARELNDLDYFDNIQHVVLELPEWPEGWSQLQSLAQVALPSGADLVVILQGWPATNAAAEAWNLLRRPVRIILLVDGPPQDRSVILRVNAVHGLGRVIASMPYPSRSGFERLQRPLSFRVVRP